MKRAVQIILSITGVNQVGVDARQDDRREAVGLKTPPFSKTRGFLSTSLLALGAAIIAAPACSGRSLSSDAGSDGGGGTGGGGAGGGCGGGCGMARSCCGGRCVNEANDPTNCGACGTRCPATTPYCGSGVCGPTPCDRDGSACAGGGLCCGSACCLAGDLCCDPQGPLSTTPVCYTPTAAAPTCPQGCAPLCISDRNLKKDFAPVDAEDVLLRLRKLPISVWTYLDEPTGLHHLGPMAQDFHASFGLGDRDDRHYNSVDAHGVALAAIQALDRLSKAQQEQLRELQQRNRILSRRIRALERGR